MPVLRYLDLSTAHLTEAEMNLLSALDDLDRNTRVANRDGLPRVIRHTYGAWVHVPTIDETSDLETHAALATTRPNLAACIAKAREYDCAWINFDRDADQDATLPTYEW